MDTMIAVQLKSVCEIVCEKRKSANFMGNFADFAERLWRISESNRWPLACHASALASWANPPGEGKTNKKLVNRKFYSKGTYFHSEFRNQQKC